MTNLRILLLWLLIPTSLFPSTLCCAEQPSQSVPLSPSALLYHKAHHRSGVEQVRKAAKLGFKEVNLVVTLRCEIDEAGRVLSYGTVEDDRYSPLNARSLAEFRRVLLETCAEARKHDLQLSILPHLDAGGKVYKWRNRFDFDPLKFYQGESYDQAMIESLVAALVGAGYADEEVHFALGGEMGRSAFLYAESYQAILKQLRESGRLPRAKLGIELNFSETAGKAKLDDAQRAAANRFLNACDFLGLSNYAPFELPPRAEQFAHSAKLFLEELAEEGVALPATMPLHISEVGLGGGSADSPVANSASEAAATPWEGSGNPRQNPWKSPELRALRVDFHEALLSFLADPGKFRDELPNPISAAFLWTEGSWDPLDIAEDGFADAEISEAILRHNRATRRGH